MVFSIEDGYTVEDMLHFGYGHVDASRKLFMDDPEYLDSAGYLLHLGVEVVFKSWHLFLFEKFDSTHDLMGLYKKLKDTDQSIDIGEDNEKFLADI